MTKRANNPQRLYENVARDLTDRIRGGEFKPSERIPSERDLAQHYEVSRPTIREAVIALEVDGLLDARPGAGVFVSAVVPDPSTAQPADVGVFELTEARRMIESEAAALAANRITAEELDTLTALVDEMQDHSDLNIQSMEDADRRFHLTIANATRNSVIAKTVETLWDARQTSAQVRYFAEKIRDRGIAPSIEQHTAILDALKGGSAELARAAMSDHLSTVMEEMLQATESEEIERTRAKIDEQRKLYLAT